jgi:hypothetical protein
MGKVERARTYVGLKIIGQLAEALGVCADELLRSP